MTSMMTAPLEGHLGQLYHMFALLKNNHNGVMVFDPMEPYINKEAFLSHNWSSTPYETEKEVIPADMSNH